MKRVSILILAGLLAMTALRSTAVSAAFGQERQFVGWTNFSAFLCFTNGEGNVEWLSPRTLCRPALEMIPSWNAELSPDGWLRVELRAYHGDQPTRFYRLGDWSRDAALHPRTSIKGQRDDDADVDTDTLQLHSPADAFQFKVTLGPATNAARLKLLAVSLLDMRAEMRKETPLRTAWGRALPVPRYSQMDYPEGGAWCSPTTVAMLLGFWAGHLQRPELKLEVPAVAQAVHDAAWKGTGNWAFNMAFAGSLPGLRGCVARFSDVRELEQWIAHGYPVGVSVCYDRLRGRERGPNGHLMVCVGFARNGDIVLNDPGTRQQIRRTFSRERFRDAWAYSKHTVYLVYPEGAELPADAAGHWTLGTSR